jgi:hypothetical protein
MALKLVEGKGFLNLMSILAPDYKVPSRNTVKLFMQYKFIIDIALLIFSSNNFSIMYYTNKLDF